MPYVALTLQPGVDTEKTLAANEMGISDSSFIRWRDGMAEKRGGWTKYIQTQFGGSIKALHPWRDISGNDYLGVGTTTQLAYASNNATVDITPQWNSGGASYTLTSAFTTTAASKIVKVLATGNNLTIYDSVIFLTHVAIDGVILYGSYPVYASVDANNFQVQTAAAATSGVTGSTGSVVSYATTSGSAIITATLAKHGYQPGDYYPAMVPTTVAGVTISGTYLITAVTTDTFTFQAQTSASTATTGSVNGGQMKIVFYTTKQPPVLGSGFGVNTYGEGTYGAGVAPTGASGSSITSSDWWLDNWGEILMACQAGGPLFMWSPSTGLKNSTLVPNAPTQNAGMCVVMPFQQIMAWGSTYNGISDPLQIRWSDAGDYTTWNADVTNQAGGYHIPTGSVIQRIIQAAQQVLVYTDIDVYAGQYVGGDTLWGFSKLASGCGLIAPKAVAIQGANAYWMSQKNFYVSSGQGVQVLPSKVWDAVFQEMNPAYQSNVVCASNAMFNEIMWFFPSMASTGANDRYVCFNTLLNEWDIGTLNRSAWVDQSILGAPIGASDGYLYQHETSNDADGQAIEAYLKTGYIALSEAQDMIFVDRVLPDMRFEMYDEYSDRLGDADGDYVAHGGGTVNLTFNVTDDLGAQPRRYGPYYFNSKRPFLPVRFRGRYVQVVIGSDDVGSFWRVGKLRMRIASDGRR